MSWLKKLLPATISVSGVRQPGRVPEGVWSKCSACQAVLYTAELKRNLYVCLQCGHHGYIAARERLLAFLDTDTKQPPIEIGADVKPVDWLKFKDTKRYKDRLSAAQRATGEMDALVAFQGSLHSLPLVAVAFEFRFIGGSMGTVVGERFVQAVEYSLTHRVPLVCFSASGGARMQEGLLSLMQMAKTSAILARLSAQSIPYISVLTHPTMGGVSASLATLGDIIISEPGALVGFAGPRVIEQVVKQTLPEGFQRAEFLLEHGAIDTIADRRSLRDLVARLLAKLFPQ